METASSQVGKASGVPRSTGPRLVRRAALALSFALIVAAAGLAFSSLQQLRSTAALTERRSQLLLPMVRLGTHLRDIDLAHRAYLASGVEAVLEPYEPARRAIPATLNQMRAQIHDNPAHQRDFARAEPLVQELLAIVASNIERRRDTRDAVADSGAVARARAVAEELRTVAADMVNRETDLVRAHVQRSERQARIAIAALFAFPLIAMAALFTIFLLVGNEVRRRRRAEAALQAANAALEERVAARTAALERELTARAQTEQKLQHVQRLDALGQLTGGIAHDFNNLLGIVIGNLDLVSMTGRPDPKTQELIDAAMGGAERGAALVQRLLAFARKQPLEAQAIDLNRQLAAIEGMLTRTLGGHITVRTVGRADLWPAFADPNQVEDAIVNLAINARDAMPGGGTLTIETANATLDERYAQENADAVPGDYVMIAVSDTGSGMAPDVVRRAFEPFFTTKAAGKGTGLGLSMVYGFAKQSGGHLTIYSEVGHGTTVRLYLPRSGDAVPDTATVDLAAPVGGDETILLVEDDDAMRQTTSDMLARLGYSVRSVPHAPAALAALHGGLQPDLLFTDIVLPEGQSGFDLADAVRHGWPGVRLLFTSGYAAAALQRNPAARQGARILSKPFRHQDLAAAVRDALDA